MLEELLAWAVGHIMLFAIQWDVVFGVAQQTLSSRVHKYPSSMMLGLGCSLICVFGIPCQLKLIRLFPKGIKTLLIILGWVSWMSLLVLSHNGLYEAQSLHILSSTLYFFLQSLLGCAIGQAYIYTVAKTYGSIRFHQIPIFVCQILTVTFTLGFLVTFLVVNNYVVNPFRLSEKWEALFEFAAISMHLNAFIIWGRYRPYLEQLQSGTFYFKDKFKTSNIYPSKAF